MSDKKYPFIGRANSGNDYLVYSKREGFKISKETFHENLNTDMFENITLEYLTNTYGKCESQEHADFICELAENHDIKIVNKPRAFFEFFVESNRLKLGFYNAEGARMLNEKLIRLPLPTKKGREMESQLPKMNVKTEMPEVKEQNREKETMTKMPEHILEEFVRMTKGVWPDDMCERYFKFSEDYDEVYYGDYKAVCEKLGWKMVYLKQAKGLHLPQKILKVGDKVKVTANKYVRIGEVMCEEYKDEVCVKFGNSLEVVNVCDVVHVPTIEDELKGWFEGYVNSTKTSSQYISEFLTKYNITPKDNTDA